MVLSESQTALTALATLAPQFNAATDSLMQELRTIEETLERLKIGLPYELPRGVATIHSSSYEEREEETGEIVLRKYNSCLAYERLPAGWGLTVRDYRGQQTNDGDWMWTLILTTPLLNAARETRIAAAPLIPALLDELVEMVTKSLYVITALANPTTGKVPRRTKTIKESAEEIRREAANMNKTSMDFAEEASRKTATVRQ